MPQQINLDVNGRSVTIAVDDPDMPLLYALRNEPAGRAPPPGIWRHELHTPDGEHIFS